MPCADLTEIITIQLNPKDEILGYSLTKKTCGKTLGNPTLILPYLKSKSAKKILKTSLEDFLKTNKPKTPSSLHEFLHSKHFLAFKTGLELISGQKEANKGLFVKQIKFNEKGLYFEAEISVKSPKEEIKSCCGQ